MDEESIFAEAMSREGADRAAYLEKACERDAALRERIEGLLAMADAHFPTIDSVTLAARPDDRVPQGLIGELTTESVVGPYRLIEKLGQGGFGVVWKAEQSEPLKRTVALKLVKRGEDSAEIVARFAQERQALALMSHPNIAQVFDAGKTESGRPFFVMELVEGEVLTKYCDARQLTIRQRLDLFLQVCEGVQHAHQKGIIHRDLKPSNVLVAFNEGGNAIPKVIDFGIAKALTPELAEEALIIHSLAIMGTPVYMSPEQALGDPGIDTRTDLYSLGVILYELLAGIPPFDPKELLRKPVDEMLRFIREQEPRKPSTQVTGADEETSRTLAEARSTAPTRMAGDLRGDLDWIVLKALAKEPDRRYRSASEFAEDIGRHLVGEPVVAAPPSTIYRCRKFVRKHRIPVTATALLIFVLIAGLAATSWQLYRGNTYRDIAGESVDHIAERAADAWMTDATIDILPLVDPELEPLASRHAAESEKWVLDGEEIRTRFQRFVVVAGVTAEPGIRFAEDRKLAAAVSWLRSLAETSDTRLIENRWKQFELGLACAHMAFVLESAYSWPPRRYAAESESDFAPIWNAQPGFGDDPVIWRIRGQYLWLNLLPDEIRNDSEISMGGLVQAFDSHNKILSDPNPPDLATARDPEPEKRSHGVVPSPLIPELTRKKKDEASPDGIDEDALSAEPVPAERSLLEDLTHWNAERIRNTLAQRRGSVAPEDGKGKEPADGFVRMVFSDDLRNMYFQRDGDFEVVPIRPRNWLPYLASDDKFDPREPLDERGLKVALEGIDHAFGSIVEHSTNDQSSAYLLGLHDALSILRAAHDGGGTRSIRTENGETKKTRIFSWRGHAEEAGKLLAETDDPVLRSLRLDFLQETFDLSELNAPGEDFYYFSFDEVKPISPTTRSAFLELYNGWLLEKIALLEVSGTDPESRVELLGSYAEMASSPPGRTRRDLVRTREFLSKAGSLIADHHDELLGSDDSGRLSEVGEDCIEIAEMMIQIGDVDSAVAILEKIITQETEIRDDPLNESRAAAFALAVDSLGRARHLKKAEAIFDFCLERIENFFSEASGMEERQAFVEPWIDAAKGLGGNREIYDDRYGSDPERAARLLAPLADKLEGGDGLPEEEQGEFALGMVQWRIQCARWLRETGRLDTCREQLASGCRWLLKAGDQDPNWLFAEALSDWLFLRDMAARQSPDFESIPGEVEMVEAGIAAAVAEAGVMPEDAEQLEPALYHWSELGRLIRNYAEWSKNTPSPETALVHLESADKRFTELAAVVGEILERHPLSEEFTDSDAITEAAMALLGLARVRAELLSESNRPEDALSVLQTAETNTGEFVGLIPEGLSRLEDYFLSSILWNRLTTAEILDATGRNSRFDEVVQETLRQAKELDSPGLVAELLTLSGDKQPAGAAWVEESVRQANSAREWAQDETSDISYALDGWVDAAESAEKALTLTGDIEGESPGDPSELLERARFESGKCRGLLDKRVLTRSIPELVQKLERDLSEEPGERRRFDLAEIEGYLLALLSSGDGDIWVRSLGLSQSQWDGIEEPHHPLTLIALASIHAVEPGNLALEIGRHSPTPAHADWLLKAALNRKPESEIAKLSAGILKKQGRNSNDSRVPTPVLGTESNGDATGEDFIELGDWRTFQDSRSIHEENASFDITSVAVRKPVDGRTEFVLSFGAALPDSGNVIIWVDGDRSAKTGDRFWGDIGSDFNIRIALDPNNQRIETTAPHLDCRRQRSERQLRVFIEGWRWEEFNFVVQENVSWRSGGGTRLSEIESGAAITLDGAIEDWNEQHVVWTSEEPETIPGFSMADLRRVQASWVGDSLFGALSYPKGARLYGDDDVSTGEPSMRIWLSGRDGEDRNYAFGVEKPYHSQHRPTFVRSPESAAYKVKDATLEFEIRDVTSRDSGSMRVSTLIQKSDFVPDSARIRSGHLEGWWRVRGTATFDGNHYKVFPIPPRNWEEARNYCKSLGGHLAIVDSPEELDFLSRLKMAHLGEKSWAWLGGYQPDDGDHWIWVDRRPIEANHWNPGEKHGNPTERFLVLDSHNLWSGYKIESGFVKGFICEWEEGEAK